MRPSLRFLALAVLGWALFRAATLGFLPWTELFRIERSEAKAPPIVATQFPPIEPVAQPFSGQAPTPIISAYPDPLIRPLRIPVYYVAQVSPPASIAPARARPPRPLLISSNPEFDEWPLSRPAGVRSPPTPAPIVQQGAPTSPVTPVEPRLDRLQLASWAILRSQQSGIAGSQSLASGGHLGASQAGVRVIYNLNRQLAFTARTSSEVGRRGGEVAAGVRVQPVGNIPLWLTAERRQAIGR